MDHVIFWSQFVAGAMLIIFSGIKLTKYADIISEKTKLGHGFIGAVLIGWSTSLPELVLSIGTSSYLGKPDMTMGNVLGSNLFNLFILVLLDFYFLEGAILRFAKKSIKVAAFLSFIIVMAVGVTICMPQLVAGGLEVGPLKVGYNAAMIFGIYLLAMLILYLVDRGNVTEQEKKYEEVTLKSVLVKCFLVVAVIVAAGLWLSKLADQLQVLYKLNESFVGSFFLAIVSSLPEVITCFVAVRMGFHSMAIGTLFGSNIFNMGIIAFCDIFYTKAYMLNDIQGGGFVTSHVSSIVLVGLMTIVTILFLRSDTENKGKFIGIESILIAGLYGFSLYLTYQTPNFLTPYVNDFIKMFG